jgi:hypothetical protein
MGLVAMLMAGALGAEVITYGQTSLGVNSTGQLNWTGSGPGGFLDYGVFRLGVGDAISPGCPCEGWGVAAGLSGGGRPAVFFNNSTGSGGAGTVTTGFTPTTATSRVEMLGGPVTVEHLYGPSLAPEVFQAQVSITNTSLTDTLTDVVYRRVMDWDVSPTPFSEYVTHVGVEANLETNGGNVRYASNNGFASANPNDFAGTTGDFGETSVNVDFTDLGPEDHGSVFDFAFGDLDPGQTRIFNIFYGSAPDEASAIARLSALNVDVYSLGQNSGPGGDLPGTPATFMFAFGGVGGAITEPGASPSSPLLPFVPAEGDIEFIFVNPPPRRWFDPPSASGFTYELFGGALFTEVGAPPDSFGFGTLEVYDPTDTLLTTLAPGATYSFLTPVSKFSIRGISLDTAAADFTTAFPTFLDWSGTADSMVMTPIISDVPEPGTFVLLGAGAVILGLMRRRTVRI